MAKINRIYKNPSMKDGSKDRPMEQSFNNNVNHTKTTDTDYTKNIRKNVQKRFENISIFLRSTKMDITS